MASVKILTASSDPIGSCWEAQHYCKSESIDPSADKTPSEKGKVDALIKEIGRGHWSVFEHAWVQVGFGGFSHNCAMQYRTHRGLSTLAQSLRYTGDRFVECYKNCYKTDSLLLIDELFVLPIDSKSRQGVSTKVADERLQEFRRHVYKQLENYYTARVVDGWAAEDARTLLPTCYKQAWVSSGSIRDWMHVLDQRLMSDTQLEARQAAEQALVALSSYQPELFSWYQENRARKNRLAP